MEENISILLEAEVLTNGDRAEAYGHPINDFGKVVRMSKALWGRGPRTEEEHAIYMILVKIAREVHSPSRDNRVDIAGYANTLQKVVEAREEEDRR